MKDELREQIIDTLERNCFTKFDIQADKILSLIAPILADAERWRKVKALSKSDNCSGCIYDHENDCVLDGMCCFSAVVDALEGEGGKP